MTWYTITPNIFHANARDWKKRKIIEDLRVALYAQTFPSFWVLPQQRTKAFKWIGEAFPPLYARYLLLRYNVGGKMLDLFAGIGGWGLGAVLTDNIEYIEMVEIDKEKCKYLEINFKQLKKFLRGHRDPFDYNIVCTDVMDYEPQEKFDIITASPPCEDFSRLRALSKMFAVELKNTIPLTLRYIEIVRKIDPQVTLYENVYSVKIREVLRRHGFTVEKHDMSKIIPQKRVRLIASRTHAQPLTTFLWSMRDGEE